MMQPTTDKIGEVGFTCGAFDLLHAGHMLVFKEAKEQACDYLIVGLQTDPSIDRPKTKNKPVMSIEERRILLEGCKYIDEIWEYDTEAELLSYLKENARANGGRIDIRVIGADYIGKPFTGHELPLVVYYNSRDHDYSTTNLRFRTFQAELEKRQPFAIPA
jgi:glycerol-3-phosphate cytidylyltransferase